jgi:hypothetical protein
MNEGYSSPKTIKNASYIKAMRQLCQIGLGIVRERVSLRSKLQHLSQISEFHSRIQAVVSHVESHLSDLSQCKTAKEKLEFWNFYLHRSYITAELCRPAIVFSENKKGHRQQEVTASLTQLCVENLKNTVDAFLGLQNVTRFATQSWAAVHRSLSCGVLLGILGEPARDEKIRLLLLRLVSTMLEAHFDVDPAEIPTPVSRSIAALQKLTPLHPLSTENVDQINNYDRFETSLTVSSTSSTFGESPQPPFSEQEQYPYTVLNSILWGNVNTRPI